MFSLAALGERQITVFCPRCFVLWDKTLNIRPLGKQGGSVQRDKTLGHLSFATKRYGFRMRQNIESFVLSGRDFKQICHVPPNTDVRSMW
jgi:hypothetical protein